MLTVQSASPEPALRPFVRAYVQREAHLGSQVLVEPVVARLGVMLEFEFAGSYEVRNYGSETVEDPNAISVIGPQSWRRSRLIIRGDIESLVIMFQPFGFNALFGVPTALLSNGGTEGHSLLGPEVSHLHQQLGNLPSFTQRVRALDTFLLRRTAAMQSSDPVYRALTLLTGSGAKVADVAHRMGISLRQLERRSLAYSGVPPKTLSRIARFSHALRLRTAGSLTWTEIAHRTHYHDHMHMIRDFRDLAGEAPTSALKEIAPDHLIHFAMDTTRAISSPDF